MRSWISAIVAVAILTTGIAHAAPTHKATRQALLDMVHSTAGRFIPLEAFESGVTEKGKPVVKAMHPDDGYMIAFVGPPEDVTHVIVVVGMSEAKGLEMTLLLHGLATEATGWDQAPVWLNGVFSESAAQQKSIVRSTEVNGRVLTVRTIQPNIINLSIDEAAR